MTTAKNSEGSKSPDNLKTLDKVFTGETQIDKKGTKTRRPSTDRPLISIVTPVFNAAKFLEETVKSVQDQTYPNWELLLVDDGSTDSSLKIAKKLALTDKKLCAELVKTGKISKDLARTGRICVISIKNSGAAVARNTGIKKANGQYLCFIDADDLWEPAKLEKQLTFMQNDTEAEVMKADTKNASVTGGKTFSFTSYAFADENGKKNGKVAHAPKTITYNQALKNTIIFTSTVMFDLVQLSKEDIYMPNVRRGQDSATWWKVLKKIPQAYGLDEPLSIYRRPTKSLSSNKLKALKRTWNLYRNVEHLNLLKSSSCFVAYCFNAVRRRV